MSDDIFTTLYQASSLMEAEMIKGLLEGAGINAQIPGEEASDPFVTARETQGDVTVEVPQASLDAARKVLEQARAEGKILEQWQDDDQG